MWTVVIRDWSTVDWPVSLPRSDRPREARPGGLLIGHKLDTGWQGRLDPQANAMNTTPLTKSCGLSWLGTLNTKFQSLFLCSMSSLAVFSQHQLKSTVRILSSIPLTYVLLNGQVVLVSLHHQEISQVCIWMDLDKQQGYVKLKSCSL